MAEICSACNGEGVIAWMAYNGRETLTPCVDCGGKGCIVPQPDRVAECHDCGGSGYASAERALGECRTCEGWGHIFVDDADHHDHAAPADHAYDLPGVPK